MTMLHINSTPLFRRVEPEPPIRLVHGHLYDLLKPLWLELRLLGALPVEKIATGCGQPVFKQTFIATLYSVTIYVIVGVCIVYTGLVKLKEVRALKTSEFDEIVNGYLFLVYLAPHFAVPICNWIQAGQIACFLNDWTTFQTHFEHVTGNTLHMKVWHKAIVILAVLIPLSTTVSIVVDWLVMPEFKLWEIYCYSYTCTLVHLHIALWFMMCYSVTSTAHRLVNILRQGLGNGRKVSDYHSLWQDLSRLSRKMGDCVCYIYGVIIVIWFAALTLSLYGGLTGILDHGVDLRGFALLANALLCTSVLFVISDAGQRLSEEMGPNFYCTLQTLHLGVNKEVRQELNMFQYDVAMNPPVISLGGYVTVNRNLLLSLLATMVSHMVILLQFRVGAEPNTLNSAKRTNVFNQ
ncbi:gustatory and odorant receptor 24-like [Zootermopsis nevadensis]|uniref:Gustatory receptor n=1 Tax=Zootermopsis nevadensis TaxID=136037 RepID=A0A067QR19_ZOONE|nr:gustatory and odorant receptor 24-like [Zootermopsis nevadensis]XP_021933827.1 gustatory and odorant receptor 24-like [Zootermopsis nevadensis]XP_021933828.1 gustatory and odorant receptor 24-like [Zootermopsis nevadensis]XP_021933829.1 gustatory and odorant receptor 24-like [Zootermopsis nevadensis]XP_021933830.1 gustatory and odorant receptor 24-like [Zootermopsis nevadensis]XP_021933831.1 gustatory and odorant receptor 24-like [Zootermopsis nevadensis]XP_021933832.1 gustatory and odoran